MTILNLTRFRTLRPVAIATIALVAFLAAPAAAESKTYYTAPDATSE